MNQVSQSPVSQLREFQLDGFFEVHPGLCGFVSPGQVDTVAALIGYEIEAEVDNSKVVLIPAPKLKLRSTHNDMSVVVSVADISDELVADSQWAGYCAVVKFRDEWHGLILKVEDDEEEEDRLNLVLDYESCPDCFKIFTPEQFQTILRDSFSKSVWAYRPAGLGMFMSAAVVID